MNMPEKKDELTLQDVGVLTAIHNKHIHLDKLLETRGQILLVIGGVVFTFALTKIIGVTFHNYTLWEYGWAIISLSSLLGISIALFAIKPKRFIKGKSVNLFYYGDFIQKLSENEYSVELTRRLGSKKEIVESFTVELYTLIKNVLIPGFKRIRLAYDIFIIGLILGFLILVSASLI